MSKLTKSPIRVAQEALLVACQRLRPYTHKFSPKKFTQPQLFACLVLKTFLKTDYRGLIEVASQKSAVSGSVVGAQPNLLRPMPFLLLSKTCSLVCS
jgi:hypothetical protein